MREFTFFYYSADHEPSPMSPFYRCVQHTLYVVYLKMNEARAQTIDGRLQGKYWQNMGLDLQRLDLFFQRTLYEIILYPACFV